MTGGGAAALPEGDALLVEEWLAIAALDGDRQRARIYLAAPIALAEIEELFADQIQSVERTEWDSRSRSVVSRRERRLDRLVLEDLPQPRPDPDALAAAMLAGIRELGLAILPWSAEARQLQARVGLMRRMDGPEAWPDLSDAALTADLEVWLAPHLGRATQPAHLARLDVAGLLADRLDWPARRRLDAEASTHLTVPRARASRSTTPRATSRCWRSACRRCSASGPRPPSPAAACRCWSTCCRRPGARCR